VLGVEMALAGRRLVQRGRLLGIGLDAVAALMHQARQAILRLDIALLGRPRYHWAAFDQVDIEAFQPQLIGGADRPLGLVISGPGELKLHVERQRLEPSTGRRRRRRQTNQCHCRRRHHHRRPCIPVTRMSPVLSFFRALCTSAHIMPHLVC
jgi:hypothetical protein